MSTRQTPDSEPQRAFDWTATEDPSSALIRAVSEVADEHPLKMEPLYGVVDPDSLDALFPRSQSLRDPSNGSVQFEYLDYVVVVKANGRGYVYDREKN